jgi:transposase
MGKAGRSGYLTDVTNEEWAFVLPYLLLSRADSGSLQHDLRAIFNAMRYVVKGGNQWRLMPNDLPPWPAAYQQMQRWRRPGCLLALGETNIPAVIRKRRARNSF